jgi:hypothetical protein
MGSNKKGAIDPSAGRAIVCSQDSKNGNIPTFDSNNNARE